jgi:hopene-associated glycosyltransferase HpnB
MEQPSALLVLAAVSLLAWVYLTVGHGRFWDTSVRLPGGRDPERWPDVVVVVPARNERELLPRTLPTLLAQDYPGRLRVLLVDDASDDGTGEVAAGLGAEVVRGGGPPAGWAGKVAAMAAGLAAAGVPELVLFTDADIAHPPGSVRRLVRASHGARLDLVSQMVRLRAHGWWERVVVPAFVYFFAQLYPFPRVNRPAARTAAAAGGCMLVRRAAPVEAGGLEPLRDALIDDVALGRLLKHRPGGGRIWLGLSDDIESVRPYPRLADLWQMVSRSAYTQLRYSPLLLLGTVLGLLLVYVVPVVGVVAGALAGDPVLLAVAGAAWLLMSVTYLPMLRLYRLGWWRAPALPLVALLYLAMTVDSAWRHRRGRGGAWKGRTA